VKSGGRPTVKDVETGENIELPLPLARSYSGGLTFTLSLAGTATWILRYRTAGRARELTIGNSHNIGLAEARKIAREKRAEVDRAGDPAWDKRRVKALALKDWTIQQLIPNSKKICENGVWGRIGKGRRWAQSSCGILHGGSNCRAAAVPNSRTKRS
jgi:hypothetical protein